MKSPIEADIQRVLRQRSGYARTRDFEIAGIGRWQLSRLCKAGAIERVRRGLYHMPDMPATNHRGLVEACMTVPGGVVFLLSALAYYDLTTFSPWQVQMAVSRRERGSALRIGTVRLHVLSERYYEPGVSVIRLPSGVIRIYDREKTLCDCIRYRNKIGLDLALEGLKNYLRLPDRNIDKLLGYGRVCRIEPLLRRYLEALQ
ncbi:MAG: type IV toxin-antitoxin system AbiEi family antitoxin domain-containing protein [Ignavibacteriales bacterium]